VAGNIGANTLAHVVSGDDGIESVTNPMPAAGGVEMETIEEVRQQAPYAFRPQDVAGQPGRPDGRTLRRAVTPADYAALTETHGDVQRAAARFRWTGSWRTVSVAVDRLGGLPVSAAFESELSRFMEPFRLAGHDVEIEPPRPVALEVSMRVHVKPGYHSSDIRRALTGMFSSRVLPDGRRGVFHPDNLTFGQTIYLSPLYTAAQAVDGVESVEVTRFQRRDRPGNAALLAGRLALSRLEIARLDNDPNFPERGTFELTLEGGR
jgi:predicted phage baseplate assembly protein